MTIYQCDKCQHCFASKQKLTLHQNLIKTKPCAEIKSSNAIVEETITITIKNFTLTQLIAMLGEQNIISFNRNSIIETKTEVKPEIEQVKPEIEQVKPEPVIITEPEPIIIAEPEPIIIAEPEPVIQTKIEKEVQLEEDKEILINNLRKEHITEVKKLQIKCTNPAVRIKKTKELNKKLNDCTDKIIKRKTLPTIAPRLNDEVVEIETTINIEKYIEIAIETHNKILDTRAKIYRIIDNAGEETKETTNLRGAMEKLTRRLLDVKKALSKAGYSPKQIQFRKEIIEFTEGKD